MLFVLSSLACADSQMTSGDGLADSSTSWTEQSSSPSLNPVTPTLTNTTESDASTSETGAETPGDTSSGPGSVSSAANSTDSGDSELESSTVDGGQVACGGVVPVECLPIVADVSGCAMDVGSCDWYACQADINLRTSIDRMDCMERECGVEPLYDLDCLEDWADLTATCFDVHCEPNEASYCSNISSGAYAECHR